MSSLTQAVYAKALDAVQVAMIQYGPDGHTDGAEEILDAALEAIGLQVVKPV